MKNLLSILIGLMIASSVSAGPNSAANISAELTANLIIECTSGPDAYDNIETCIAGAVAARDAAVNTALKIEECKSQTDAAACLTNINK